MRFDFWGGGGEEMEENGVGGGGCKIRGQEQPKAITSKLLNTIIDEIN